jgi:hypothetical protein
MFMLGLVLFSLDTHLKDGGLGLMVASGAVAAISLVIQQFRKRPTIRPRHFDPQSTVAWRPYRTASARVTEDFIQRLSRMESELQKAAHEEGWEIDWPQHDAVMQSVEAAIQKRKLARALNEFAKAFDLLMVGVHVQRKQLQHDTRWGKGSNPSVKSKP